MDPRANKQRAVDAVAAFNCGDVEPYLASYAPDAVIRGLPVALPSRLDGHRKFVAALRAGSPDVSAKLHDIVLGLACHR